MTRINLVDPSLLTDQHLFAEFREIKMVPKALGRAILSNYGTHNEQARVLAKVPESFRLNGGHVMFFYDKGAYLRERYALIKMELFRRGINYNVESPFDPELNYQHPAYNNHWTPDADALAIIRERLVERIMQKPDWYRYYGKSIVLDQDVFDRVCFR